MEKCQKVAALYVATLQALSIIATRCHWTTQGADFYGDHLLFERIYKGLLRDLDLAAEKGVGLFSTEILDYDLQNNLLSSVLKKYSALEGSPAQMLMAGTKDFIKYSQQANNCFEQEGKLTLGLADMLGEISDNAEGYVYLLQQSLK